MATKRQHFVQRHYLEAWTNNDGLLAVLRLGDTPKLQTPKNTAVVNSLYSLSVPTLEECSRIKTLCEEEHFPEGFVKYLFCICYLPAIQYQLECSEVNPAVLEIANFLIKEQLLPEEQDAELRELLKQGRECSQNSNTHAKVTEGLEPFITRIEQNFNQTLNLLRDNPRVGSVGNPHDLIDYLALQMVRTPSFLNRNSKKGMADMLIGAFRYLWKISSNFEAYYGKVAEIGNAFSDLEFITSDNPVVNFAPKFQNSSVLPQIFFPLTPKKCFMLSTGPVSIMPDQVQLWNDKMFEESYDEIYATNANVLERYIRPCGIK